MGMLNRFDVCKEGGSNDYSDFCYIYQNVEPSVKIIGSPTAIEVI